jgi:hypothetical protein
MLQVVKPLRLQSQRLSLFTQYIVPAQVFFTHTRFSQPVFFNFLQAIACIFYVIFLKNRKIWPFPLVRQCCVVLAAVMSCRIFRQLPLTLSRFQVTVFSFFPSCQHSPSERRQAALSLLPPGQAFLSAINSQRMQRSSPSS